MYKYTYIRFVCITLKINDLINIFSIFVCKYQLVLPVFRPVGHFMGISS